MRVKELKKLLENVPDDAIILLEGRDHSYYKGRATLAEVENLNNHFFEWFGEEHSSGGKVEKHLVISA